MTAPLPVDPVTALAAAATQLHELYESYVAAGFTEEQALRLVVAALQVVAPS